jgi:cytochrome c biogenesis protein CcmG/thiol:disulfide interchange protein DsbE
MRSWGKLAVLAIAAIAAAQILVRGREPSAETGKEAPAFTLPDTQGRAVSLASMRGRVVALNFWATWCGPCREEIPELAAVYAKLGEGCFDLLGVAEESGTREEVVAAARKLGVNYPVLLDERGAAGDLFRIPGYPRTYLLDAQGRIRRVFQGAVQKRELEEALAPLLAEAPAPCPRRL